MGRFHLLLSSRRNRRTAAVPPSRTRPEKKSFSFSGPGLALDGVDWGRVKGLLLTAFFLLLWLGLWLRAAQVQLLDGPFLAERARRQHLSAEIINLPRGMITDRNGLALARSVECGSVYANPAAITDPDAVAAALAPLIRQPVDKVRAALLRNRHFSWIARRVDDATAEAVRQANLPGIELAREYERVYPYRQVAGQLLGFVGMDGKGLEGIERAFEPVLAATKSRQVVQRDATGRRFHIPEEGEAKTAEDVALTLDLHVQFIAEDVLARTVAAEQAKWGGMLVVEVASGDILAWAQYPFFNPNLFRGASPGLYRNRLALDALEPGSTFKPFLVAAAMQEGLINRNSKFNCEYGNWRTRTITIRDDGRSYAVLPVHRIVAMSSNIGCAKIGLLLGAQRYQKFLASVGFGQRTGLQIAESKGIVRAPRDWSEADVISASFGQSVSVTAVQMAQAYLILANQGVYKPLNLTLNPRERLQDSGQRLFSARIAREVLSIMREVVDDGTGRRAAIPGLSVAGKTGTAQKAERFGKYGDERMASFVGMVPAENPRYLVVVMLDEPGLNKYGGAIAAPAFREALTRTLAYYGEMPAETRAAARPPRPAATALPSGTGQIRKELNTASPLRTLSARNGIIPDVTGKPLRQAVEMFARQGIVPQLRGEGPVVTRQEPAPGVNIRRPDGTVMEIPCTLWLSEKTQ